MAIAFSYVNSSLYAPEVNSGILEETRKKWIDHAKSSFSVIDSQIHNGSLAFISSLQNEDAVTEIQELSNSLSWAKSIVIVGIGGSDLGARVILEAFGWQQCSRIIFHGDSTDPVQLQRLLSQIELKSTAVVVVSKSGNTVETVAAYLLLKQEILKLTDAWQDHFVFITDEVEGYLRKEASFHNVKTLGVPKELGGRFSVLSAVGLFPAAVAGISIHELISGAKTVVDSTEYHEIAKNLAFDQFLLLKQGISVVSLMPYSVQLIEFGRWFRQLWAETLGKNSSGILPIASRGPADQHSQVQFYAQGSLLLSVLTIGIKKSAVDFTVPTQEDSEVQHLSNTSLLELLHIEERATVAGLKEHSRPVASLQISELNPKTLGMLFMMFELAVVYLAQLLEVTPFDQPGVESGKKHMKQLLESSTQ